jgi:hypothetical protein
LPEPAFDYVPIPSHFQNAHSGSRFFHQWFCFSPVRLQRSRPGKKSIRSADANAGRSGADAITNDLRPGKAGGSGERVCSLHGNPRSFVQAATISR